MPIYEYECEQCRDHVELIQKHTDPPLATCPKCGGSLRKLIAAPALQFKGSGWYVTDYSEKGRTKTEGAPAESKPAKESPASASPSTPEKKTESVDSASKPAASSGEGKQS